MGSEWVGEVGADENGYLRKNEEGAAIGSGQR